MHNPKSIANVFIGLASADGVKLDPMKLQKLVYYANGWYAGATGKPLINESVEAWPYGPVIPSLYHEFKRFGRNSINAPATEFDPVSEALLPVATPDNPDIRQFLAKIWKSYSKYTGGQLSEMTHATGSPWDETFKKAGDMRGVDIPLESLVKHFQAVIAKSKAAAKGAD